MASVSLWIGVTSDYRKNLTVVSYGARGSRYTVYSKTMKPSSRQRVCPNLNDYEDNYDYNVKLNDNAILVDSKENIGNVSIVSNRKEYAKKMTRTERRNALKK